MNYGHFNNIEKYKQLLIKYCPRVIDTDITGYYHSEYLNNIVSSLEIQQDEEWSYEVKLIIELLNTLNNDYLLKKTKENDDNRVKQIKEIINRARINYFVDKGNEYKLFPNSKNPSNSYVKVLDILDFNIQNKGYSKYVVYYYYISDEYNRVDICTMENFIIRLMGGDSLWGHEF